MQPSSLIFLVIIAVWAAYFVQYWVRRREHLATAHSVDQFSETMRVLERRSPLPATDLSTPARSSYAVSPARVVRAQVLVKRAETTTFTMTPSGAVTPGAAPVAPATSGRSGGWDAAVEPEDDGHSWDVESAPQIRPARAVRGLTLLAALVAFVGALPLAAFGVLPWVGVLVPLAVTAGAVVWLRQAVAAEQAGRREARREAGREPRRSEHTQQALPRRQTRPAQSADNRPAVRRAAPAAAPAATEAPTQAPEEVDQAPARVGGGLYDLQEVERELAAPRPASPVAPATEDAAPAATAAPAPRPLVDEDDIPLTWDPVPVPRPTYTMKSRATRPAPTSADLVGDADTEYARYEQEPVRRVAGA